MMLQPRNQSPANGPHAHCKQDAFNQYLQGICDGYNVDVVTLLSHWLYIPPAELFNTNWIINHALQSDTG